MENIAVDEYQYERHNSRPSSITLLGQWDRPLIEFNSLGDEEQTQRQHRSVGGTYLICLTLGAGGLQVIWSAIMGQGSPYLSSLGIPRYMISIIWLAGPLSGALVQPYFSVISNQSCHPWGKRKPYILLGTICTIFFMLLLPRTGDIISYTFSCFGRNYRSTVVLVFKRVVAALLIWMLNIAIQPVQLGIRTLIVEACPPHQQVQAATYASCISGVGNVFGYGIGFVQLPLLLPWFGSTQFKCLSVIASFALGLTVAVTLSFIKEDEVGVHGKDIKARGGVLDVLRQAYKNMGAMPKDIKRVCKVQFFAWAGWFPFLFYITTYTGSIYEKDLQLQSKVIDSKQFRLHIHSDSIQYGNLAMFLFAIVALLSNLLVPFIVSSIPKISQDIRNLTLPRAWALSHILTTTILLSTYLTRSTIPTAFIVSLLGIPWAVTQWAPLALISASIAAHRSYQTPPPTYNGYPLDEEGEKREEDSIVGTGDLDAGAIMGIYNIAIAAPQIVAAVGTSGTFWVLGWSGLNDDEVVGWAIRIWGLAGLVAAWLAAGIDMKTNKRTTDEDGE